MAGEDDYHDGCNDYFSDSDKLIFNLIGGIMTVHGLQ